MRTPDQRAEAVVRSEFILQLNSKKSVINAGKKREN